MDLGLQGKTALVVASSAGLGFAAADALAGEGANVVISGRDAARLAAAERALQATHGPERVAARQMDVLVSADNDRLVAFAVEQFGGLDILITNAGGPPGGSFDTTDLDAWQRGIDLTLMSVVELIQAALPHLRQSDARTRWYPDTRGIWNGFSKNAFGALDSNYAVAMLTCFVLVPLLVAPFVRVPIGLAGDGVPTEVWVQIALFMVARVVSAVAGRDPLRSIPLHPVTAAFWGATLLRSTWLSNRDRSVSWRGRTVRVASR